MNWVEVSYSSRTLMLDDPANISDAFSTTDAALSSPALPLGQCGVQSRVAWIRWRTDESQNLQIESMSESVSWLGLQQLVPGARVPQLLDFVRQDERSKLADHFNTCLADQALEIVCVRLKNEERWLEFETQIQNCRQTGRVTGVSVIVDTTRRVHLELENANLNQIIDAIPSWIFVKDEEHKYVRVNSAYASVYELTPDECAGKTSIDLGVAEELALGNPEKGIRGFYADDDWVFATGKKKHIPSEPIVIDGQMRFLNTVKVPIYDSLNERPLILGLAYDITHLKDIESKMGVELRYNKTLNDINAIFHSTESAQRIYDKVCDVTFESLECDRVRIINRTPLAQTVVAEKPTDSAVAVDNDCHRFSAVVEFADYPFGYLEVEREISRPEFSPDDKRLVQAIANHLALAIQRNQLNQEIHHQARHDSLTDLPNRHMLMSALREAVADCQSNDSICAMILLDLDEFKHINDTMGHDVGDLLLLAVSRRLARISNSNDLLTRLGGDEFAILVTGFANREYVLQRAGEFLSQFQEPFHIGDRELVVGASLGISIFPYDANDSMTLLKNADMAMYESKNSGKNASRLFSPEIAEKAKRRQELEAELRLAISEQRELSIAYQPKICLNTGKPVGVEALLRWNSSVLGNVSPAEFIPVAEDSGLILQLGSWVLRNACNDFANWNKQISSDIVLSVNASLVELEQQDFFQSARSIMNECSLDPRRLEFEVTESMFMSHHGQVYDCLNALRNLGVGISIDDFGTGYSCMSYLQKLPVDILKIDKSFVDLLAESTTEMQDSEMTIAATIVGLAKSLNLKTVAEGVESECQAKLLRQIGVDIGQGFFFSRPLAPAEALDFLIQSS